MIKIQIFKIDKRQAAFINIIIVIVIVIVIKEITTYMINKHACI